MPHLPCVTCWTANMSPDTVSGSRFSFRLYCGAHSKIGRRLLHHCLTSSRWGACTLPHSALFFFLFAPVIFQIPSCSSQLLQTREREWKKKKTLLNTSFQCQASVRRGFQCQSYSENKKWERKKEGRERRGREEKRRERRREREGRNINGCTELGVLLCRVQLIVLDKN